MILLPKAHRLPHVLWRICHWLLMVSPLLVLVVGLVSFFTPIRYTGFSEFHAVCIHVIGGRADCCHVHYSHAGMSREWEKLLNVLPQNRARGLSDQFEFMFICNEPSDGSHLVPGGMIRNMFALRETVYTQWGTLISFPLWALFVLLAIYPAVVLCRGYHRWRRRRGEAQCVACGYDLTGNVSGICPECGVEPSEAQRERLASIGMRLEGRS